MLAQFTFAIITDGSAQDRVVQMIDNIRARAGIRDYEILVIGGPFSTEVYYNETQVLRYIPAENEWIVQKKNMIPWIARYPDLVVMHDYFLLDEYWYEGWEEFNETNDWDICSNPQKLMDGRRHFTDWVIWDHPHLPRYHSLEYWDWSNTQHQYISGGYFVCKRKVLVDEPFNVEMKQGMPEDVEWSLRVRDKYKIKCNPYSCVTHSKIHRDMR